MEVTGLRAPRDQELKASAPARKAPEPAPLVSAHRNLVHSATAHSAPGHQVLGRHNSALAAPHGRRTIVQPVLRLGLGSGRRAPSSVQLSLDRHLRVKTGQLVDLRRVAALMALALSKRSRGRSPIPHVRIVLTVRHSNRTPAPAATLSLIVKKSGLPDPPGCRLRQSSPSAKLRSAPPQAAPRLAARQRADHHFEVPGQRRVAPAKAAPASSGRGQTGPDQIAHGPIEHAPTGQGQTVQHQTGPVLIALPSTAPAVPAQPAVPAAPALGNSAPAGLPAPKAAVRAPSPPAPENPAPAEHGHPTNALAHPSQENRPGSPRRAALAGHLPQVAQNQPSAPAQSLEGFQNPALAIKAKPAVHENRAAAHVPAANARVESQAEKSEADGLEPELALNQS